MSYDRAKYSLSNRSNISQNEKQRKPSTSQTLKKHQLNKSSNSSQIKQQNDISQATIDKADNESKLQFKIIEKNEEIRALKEEMIQLQISRQQDKRVFQKEKNELERKIDHLGKQISEEQNKVLKAQMDYERLAEQMSNTNKVKKHLEENTSAFDKITNQLRQELNDKQQKLQEYYLQLQQKDADIYNLEDRLQTCERKIEKLKKKLDDRKKWVLENQINDAETKRSKNQQLNQQISELQGKLVQLMDESKKFKQIKESLTNENNMYKEKIQKYEKENPYFQEYNKVLQMEKEDLQFQANKMNIIIKEQKSLIDELTEQNQQLEKKTAQKDQILSQVSKEQENDQILLKQYKDDNSILCEELRNYKELVDKMERQNQIIAEVQNKDLDSLEQKVERISKEIIRQKQINEQLRQQEKKLIEELDLTSNELEKARNLIQEERLRNKKFEKQLQELDDKLQEMVKEKKYEMIHNQNKLPTRNSVGSHLKKLENLENRIKKSQLYSDESSISD